MYFLSVVWVGRGGVGRKEELGGFWGRGGGGRVGRS